MTFSVTFPPQRPAALHAQNPEERISYRAFLAAIPGMQHQLLLDKDEVAVGRQRQRRTLPSSLPCKGAPRIACSDSFVI
jgi:hypothetical protein